MSQLRSIIMTTYTLDEAQRDAVKRAKLPRVPRLPRVPIRKTVAKLPRVPIRKTVAKLPRVPRLPRVPIRKTSGKSAYEFSQNRSRRVAHDPDLVSLCKLCLLLF